MRQVEETKQFRRDVKRALKHGENLAKLYRIVERLAKEEPLDPKYRDHGLRGDYILSSACVMTVMLFGR